VAADLGHTGDGKGEVKMRRRLPGGKQQFIVKGEKD
jgi:hypothetical protein